MTFSHTTDGGCHDSDNQPVRYFPGEYKLRDIVGGDGCALCTELKLLELLRDELTRKTALLRVKINLSHSAINRQLPPEILATIFEAYVHDPSYEDFDYEAESSDYPPSNGNPLLLGAVCRTWRDIAWSTPRLWATLTVHVDFRHARQAAQTRLAQEWLARSGRMPLSIRLVDDLPQQHTDDISSVRPLISLINQYAHRWRNLHIHLPTFLFPFFKPVDGHAPMLEYLRVQGKHHFLNDDSTAGDTRDVLRFGMTPSLKYMSIRRISLVNVNVGWENLTHFASENLSVVECLEVVRRASLLEHCVFRSTSGSTEGYTLPSTPILAQNLRTFSVTFPNQNGQALMNSVTGPALEALAVTAPPSGCLPAFFLRSHCPLQRLSLTFFGDQAKYLVGLLRAQPSLTALNLGWSPLPDLLLSELAAEYDEQALESPESSVFLPNLEALEFTGMTVDFAWAKFADIFPPLAVEEAQKRGDLVNMSEAPVVAGSRMRRYTRPWRSVRMTLVRDVGSGRNNGLPYIPEHLLQRLRQSIAAGVEIEVKVTSNFDNVDMKDWMQISQEHHDVCRANASFIQDIE